MFENFTRQKDFLICVDSDGCALDTMEVKQRQAFIPETIKYWGMENIADDAWEVMIFTHLYSQYRGLVRYELLVRAIDFLKERGVPTPNIDAIRAFVADDHYEKTLPGLMQYEKDHPAPGLNTAIVWAQAIDITVKNLKADIRVFPLVRESLERLQERADIVVISVTPTEQLTREWESHDLAQYANLITGQEFGAKAKRIASLLKLGYAAEKVLMMGDAPGDWRAADANGVLFYPILAGQEDQSWQAFYDEHCAAFLEGRYHGALQDELIAAFNANLPYRLPQKD